MYQILFRISLLFYFSIRKVYYIYNKLSYKLSCIPFSLACLFILFKLILTMYQYCRAIVVYDIANGYCKTISSPWGIL